MNTNTENIKNVRHCRYCELHEFELNKGVICTLTGELGEFSSTCPSIKFDNILVNKIFDVNIAVEYLKYLKPRAFLNFSMYLLVGIIVHILNYFVTIMIFNKGFLSTLTITIFILGMVLIGFGLGSLRFYYTKKKNILPKKKELDIIVKLYGINYNFSTKIKSDILGNEKTESTLRLNGEFFERSDNIALLSTTR